MPTNKKGQNFSLNSHQVNHNHMRIKKENNDETE